MFEPSSEPSSEPEPRRYCSAHRAWLPTSAFRTRTPTARNCDACASESRRRELARKRTRRHRHRTQPTEAGTVRCSNCARAFPLDPDAHKRRATCETCRAQKRAFRSRDDVRCKEADQRARSINLRLVKTKSDARRRNLVVTMTDDDLRATMRNPCRWCGAIHDRGFQGLDRVDNRFGYVPGNVVPCCTTCNHMKRALDWVTFLERAVHIAHHQTGSDRYWRSTTCWSPRKKYDTYRSYKVWCERKGRAFDLSWDDYVRMRNTTCTHCGTNPASWWDRIDRKQGYLATNVLPSCGNCNLFRGAFSLETFHAQCANIADHAIGTGTFYPGLTSSIPRNPHATRNRKPDRTA